MIDLRIGHWVSVDAGDLELGSHDPLEPYLGTVLGMTFMISDADDRVCLRYIPEGVLRDGTSVSWVYANTIRPAKPSDLSWWLLMHDLSEFPESSPSLNEILGAYLPDFGDNDRSETGIMGQDTGCSRSLTQG